MADLPLDNIFETFLPYEWGPEKPSIFYIYIYNNT
jgi:hypothetical protein